MPLNPPEQPKSKWTAVVGKYTEPPKRFAWLKVVLGLVGGIISLVLASGLVTNNTWTELLGWIANLLTEVE